MKTVSQDYIDSETSEKRKPVELYHIWRDTDPADWYYTSGDVAVTYDSHEYIPAAIKRSAVSYDDKLDVTTMSMDIGYLEDPALEFIAVNPVEIMWVGVMKLHRDQVPLEADAVFIGQLKNVSFKGVAAKVSCVGFEHFLKMPIPVARYQIACNHHVFDAKCGLLQASYGVATVVTVDAQGTILTSADFALQADGYFTGGKVLFGTIPRGIAAHVGSAITLVYRIPTLASGNSVTAYPGCDGRIRTCRDKFANIVHFLGFPFIPQDNPAVRTP